MFIFLNVYNPNDLILEEKVLREKNNHLKTFESQKNVFLYIPSSSPVTVIFFDAKLLERNVSPCCTPCALLILSKLYNLLSPSTSRLSLPLQVTKTPTWQVQPVLRGLFALFLSPKVCL